MASAPGPLKCEQTGHFFGYFPEQDVGFTCFECLEDFAPSGRRPALSYASGYLSGASRKRRSLHYTAVPLPSEGNSSTGSQTPVGEVDPETGKRRSRPWRCLQMKCRLLACDTCSDKLIDPEYAKQANSKEPRSGAAGGSGGAGEAEDKAAARLRGGRLPLHQRVQMDAGGGSDGGGDGAGGTGHGQREKATQQFTGVATPPEKRGQRELIKDGGSWRNNIPAHKLPPPIDEKTIAAEDGPMEVESDSDASSDRELSELRNKLSYRRAATIATNYHPRGPTRTYRHPAMDTTITTCTATAPNPPPPSSTSISTTESMIPPPPLQPLKTLAVEVDSDDDAQIDELPRLVVRSASMAANQALRGVHQSKWREAGGRL